MSINLPPISLASATVGTTGSIDLTKVAHRLAPKFLARPDDDINTERLCIFNESGCGLRVQWADSGGTQHTIIAGRQATLQIPPNESTLLYTVVYVIPQATVTSLLADYYAPGEKIPDTGLLGNSPVGGSIVTTSATSLNLVSSDLLQSVYLDDTSFAGVSTLIPSQYPNPTGARDIGLAARTGAASAILVAQTDGANNRFQLKSHLAFPDNPDNIDIGGIEILTATGSGTFSHSLGVTPRIVLLVCTATASSFFVGSYTTTQFTVSGVTGQWKALLIA